MQHISWQQNTEDLFSEEMEAESFFFTGKTIGIDKGLVFILKIGGSSIAGTD